MAVVERDVLTPEQVADYLQIQPRTVMEWLRAGRLPGLKLGRLWRIRRRDLDGFLQLRQFAAGDPDRRRPTRDYTDTEIADMLETDRLEPGDAGDASGEAVPE